MSKKINTTSIGLFIVIGVALGVIGLLLFSSSKMFSKTRDLIVYFDESLNGLNEGAPVKFRGVTVGSVKRVMVRYNQAPNDMSMPVILEIQDKLVHQRLGDAAGEEFFAKGAEAQTKEERFKAGLRASLQSESLVTGVLYIDIRIDPNAPPPVFHQIEKLYAELPTEATEIEQLFEKLASLDIKSLISSLNALIIRVDSAVGELKLNEISAGVTNLLASTNSLVADPDIKSGLAAIRPTLDQYRELGAKVSSRVDPVADSVSNSLAEANRTLAQLRSLGENLRAMIGPDSPIRNDVDLTLQQLAGAAQSVSSLVDFLKQHPNALIAGREPSKNQ